MEKTDIDIFNERVEFKTSYRSTLEKVCEISCRYKLSGTQLNTVYKIVESLRGIR